MKTNGCSEIFHDELFEGDGKGLEVESYLNSCSVAGCRFNGPVTYHLNCGSQTRYWCEKCGELLSDTADGEVKMKEVLYICRQCEEEGVQPGHFACGTTSNVPERSSYV